jgi:hypothetical protein
MISFTLILCLLSTRTGKNITEEVSFSVVFLLARHDLNMFFGAFRCEMEDILLEMDRILRPEGSVIFRDDVDIVIKIRNIIDRLDWESQIVDHEDGPHQREKLLVAVKKYWTAPAPDQDEPSKIH